MSKYINLSHYHRMLIFPPLVAIAVFCYGFVMMAGVNQNNNRFSSQSHADTNKDESSLEDLTTPLQTLSPVFEETVSNESLPTTMQTPKTTNPQTASSKKLQSGQPNNQSQSPNVNSYSNANNSGSEKLIEVAKPLSQTLNRLPIGF